MMETKTGTYRIMKQEHSVMHAFSLTMFMRPLRANHHILAPITIRWLFLVLLSPPFP